MKHEDEFDIQSWATHWCFSNVTNLTITSAMDGVNRDNALFGQMISDDHTRAARIAASFSRVFAKLTIAASGTASFDVNILGAQVTSPLLSDRTFKKLNLRFGADAKLLPLVTLRLRGIGQYSNDRLLAVKQMALGGDEFGRAFEYAIVIGDSGLAGSAELAYSPKRLAVANKAMFQLEAAEALDESLSQMHNAWRVVFGYKSLY